MTRWHKKALDQSSVTFALVFVCQWFSHMVRLHVVLVIISQAIGWEEWVSCTSQEIGWEDNDTPCWRGNSTSSSVTGQQTAFGWHTATALVKRRFFNLASATSWFTASFFGLKKSSLQTSGIQLQFLAPGWRRYDVQWCRTAVCSAKRQQLISKGYWRPAANMTFLSQDRTDAQETD